MFSKGRKLKACFISCIKNTHTHTLPPPLQMRREKYAFLESPVSQDVSLCSPGGCLTSEVLGPVEHPSPGGQQAAGQGGISFIRLKDSLSQAEDSPTEALHSLPGPGLAYSSRFSLPAQSRAFIQAPLLPQSRLLGSVLQRCHPLNAPCAQPHPPGLCCPAHAPCLCGTSGAAGCGFRGLILLGSGVRDPLCTLLSGCPLGDFVFPSPAHT